MVGLGGTVYFAGRAAGGAASYLLVVLMFAAIWLALPFRKRAGVLVATPGGLGFNTQQFAPWLRVTALVPAGDRALYIRWRGRLCPRTVAFELADAADARRILEHAARHVPRLEIDAGSLGFDIGFVLAFATIVIGADGIESRGVFRQRFVGADRIAGCTVLGTVRLRVDLADGEAWTLRVPGGSGDAGESDLDTAYAHGLRDYVLGIRRAAPALSEAQHGALRRGTRSLAEWLTALRGAAPAPRSAVARAALASRRIPG